jgi:ribose transport system permease protein
MAEPSLESPQISLQASGGTPVWNRWRRGLLDPNKIHATGIRFAAVVVFFGAWLALPGFRTTANLNAIMYSVSVVGSAAVGMSLITLGGNLFMLSVGATAAFATILFASSLSLGLFSAVLIVILVGAFIGWLQGVIVGIFRGNPIIGTVAVSSIITGIGAFWSGGQTVMGKGNASWLGTGRALGIIPNQLLMFIVVALCLQFVLEHTRFGRELKLIGTNREAARIAGLRVQYAVIVSYTIAGGGVGLAGALLASQAAQGNLQLGAGLDFDAIAAVLVGGVSIRGGRGTITDAAVGAIFLAIVENMLLTSGLSYDVQLVVKGAVVLCSLIAGSLLLRFAKR